MLEVYETRKGRTCPRLIARASTSEEGDGRLGWRGSVCAASMRRSARSWRTRSPLRLPTRVWDSSPVTDVKTSPDLRARPRLRERARRRRRPARTAAGSAQRARHAPVLASPLELPPQADPRRLEFVYDTTTDRALRVESLLREPSLSETSSIALDTREQALHLIRSEASALSSRPTNIPTGTRSARSWQCRGCCRPSGRTRSW